MLPMRRGDVVIVALPGDYGKPRPAIVVQSDSIPATLDSVLVCPLTSTITPATALRVNLDPGSGTGLRLRSQAMVDKLFALRRTRVGATVGHLTDADMARLDTVLAFVLGLAG